MSLSGFPASSKSSPGSTRLLSRLLALSWHYRRECLTVFGFQVALLALGITGLGLSGVAIDVTRAALLPGTPAPHWPLGITPPHGWSSRQELIVIGSLVLLMAATRGALNYWYSIAVGRADSLEARTRAAYARVR